MAEEQQRLAPAPYVPSKQPKTDYPVGGPADTPANGTSLISKQLIDNDPYVSSSTHSLDGQGSYYSGRKTIFLKTEKLTKAADTSSECSDMPDHPIMLTPPA